LKKNLDSTAKLTINPERSRRVDLSIIIVNYNTKNLLEKCLESLQKSGKNLNCQIFVVDNASQDNSVKMVKEKFPKVITVQNSHNLGFAKANNLAIKKSTGKYILLLNPDAQVEKNTLSEMADFMDKNPKVGVATCKVLLPSGELDLDCRRSFPTPWVSFTHFSKLSKIFPKSRMFAQYQLTYLDDNKISEVDSCVGAFMMIRSAALKEVGLLDENFFFYGEDIDWCFRFKEKGWKVLYYPKVKIIHYKGASSGMKKTSKHVTCATKDAKKNALAASTAAMEIFYRKHYIESYPKVVSFLVFSGIRFLKKFRLLRV
jgi:GT2 family glycosyltransferase